MGRESKDNDAMSRTSQNQVSFMNSNMNKRVSSAKSKQEKKDKKVVYDRISSKKSLKNEEYGQNNREMEGVDDFLY